MKKIFFMLLFCSSYLMIHAQAKKPATPAKSSVPQASMTKGKLLYAKYCLACHQIDGSGVPHLNPPLIKTDWVLGNKQRLIGVILKGMTGEIEINGEFYQNNMPPLNILTDQEIADVLTYVRNSFGNKASPVTAAEVKGTRAKIK